MHGERRDTATDSMCATCCSQASLQLPAPGSGACCRRLLLAHLAPLPPPCSKNMLKILGEDKAMVELLRPEALAAEYSLSPDGPQVAFRKLRDEWASLGYLSRHGLARAPRDDASSAAADM